jgi:hypothetical protein
VGVIPTAIGAGLCLILTVFCGWRGALKPKGIAQPRLIPWRALMLVGFVAMLLFLVHLVALYRNGGMSAA